MLLSNFWQGYLAGSLSLLIFILILKLLLRRKESQIERDLIPLKEKLDSYQGQLLEQRERSIKQEESLRSTIFHMLESNRKIEDETSSLFKALKGNNQFQGNWGEVVLESLLRNSGLVKDKEYTLQGVGLKLKSDEGKHLKPDAIVHLPEKKCIVIDSKVSLVSVQNENIVKLKRSLLSHIDELSSKKYHHIDKFMSPDFVVMFIPVESTMSLIYKDIPDVIDTATRKNIILAGPSSLLPILQTISSLWRLSKQNENSVEIAKQAGLMFDKFILFIDEVQKVKKSISKLGLDFDHLDKKLHQGQGNLVERAQKLKELGAKTSK